VAELGQYDISWKEKEENNGTTTNCNTNTDTKEGFLAKENLPFSTN
jgi:hypothetical protein